MTKTETVLKWCGDRYACHYEDPCEEAPDCPVLWGGDAWCMLDDVGGPEAYERTKKAMSMDYLGMTVSHKRMSAGELAIKEMLPRETPLDRLSVLKFFCENVERDTPAALLAPKPPSQIAVLDLTGRYRLLATILGG